MKKSISSVSFLLFLLITIWIVSSRAGEKSPEQILSKAKITIRQIEPGVEDAVKAAHKAAFHILRDYLIRRKVNPKFENMAAILSYLGSHSPEVGKTTKFLVDEYLKKMGEVENELGRLAFLELTEKQVEMLVRTKLIEPDKNNPRGFIQRIGDTIKFD